MWEERVCPLGLGLCIYLLAPNLIAHTQRLTPGRSVQKLFPERSFWKKATLQSNAQVASTV